MCRNDQEVKDLLNHHVVLALDAELFAGMPGSLRYAREFMERRRVGQAFPLAGSPEETGDRGENSQASQASQAGKPNLLRQHD